LPALREEIAARYSALYGVEVDPHSEVTIMPGTKTAICELALVLAERLLAIEPATCRWTVRPAGHPTLPPRLATTSPPSS
jgi:hypothetical protein